ncbi:DnaJ C-terminal domain-containing protein [Skermanella pratensis]|uniref:DnaJ C-terminal domain-containing protein n=1 Tax=Skermanella pratensis TaxID=2233999 RepID=UPI0013011ECB|nr:J domain-containing protein [Skermanella pratensis]
MRDPYQVLGLTKSASAEEIKQAYRRLAKQFHPDLNPGRPDIEQRFKDVSGAYNLLSDAEKRAKFDRGEIDANGNERPLHRAYAGGGRGGADFGGFDADDIFSDLFGAGRRRGGAGHGGFKSRGTDIAYSVTVPFTEAALGTKRRINLSTGKSIDVAIPPGTEDQQKLRLKGQGMSGIGGGPAGDAIVEVHVETHPFFVRKDGDIHLELPISLPEAVLGATIKVPTLDGQVAVKVPRGSNTGGTLRLKGKGIVDPKTGVAGDQYVKLKVVLPEPPDAELTGFLERWSKDRSYDVRKKLGLG